MIPKAMAGLFFPLLAGMALLSCGSEENSNLGVEEVIQSYFQYVNEERFEEFYDLFDPDVDFHAPFGFEVRGVDEVKPFYNLILASAGEHFDTPRQIIVSGNQAAVLVEATAGSGSSAFTFEASDWFVIENGKIKSLHIFFDALGVADYLTGQ